MTLWLQLALTACVLLVLAALTSLIGMSTVVSRSATARCEQAARIMLLSGAVGLVVAALGWVWVR